MDTREETLREAACSGDERTVRSLAQSGVNVNAQNHMNGWCVPPGFRGLRSVSPAIPT